MEHLLPPGHYPFASFPYPQSLPDKHGRYVTWNEARYFLGHTIARARIDTLVGDGSFTSREAASRAIWNQVCTDGRTDGLCHFILEQLFFEPMRLLFGEASFSPLDFTAPHNDESHQVLTTQNLERQLEAWKSSMMPIDDGFRHQKKLDAHRVLAERTAQLDTLASFIKRLRVEFAWKTQPYESGLEMLSCTHAACTILHEALVEASGRILGVEVRKGNELCCRSRLPWLERKMKLDGWCPSIVHRVYDIESVESGVWAYAMGTVRRGPTHNLCTQEDCYANTLDESSEPAHFDGCGDCAEIEAPMHEMAALMRQGYVPVLDIHNICEDRPTLSATAAGRNASYVAISHVWADGLGLARRNCVQQCQLARLAEYLAQIQQVEGCSRLYLWVDSLCVPVDPHFTDLRTAQVQKMHQIYRDSFAALIIDADLQTLSKHAQLPEIGMRLFNSAWQSRLWVWQEAALPERVLIAARDGLIDIDEHILNSKIYRLERNPLQHRLWYRWSMRVRIDLGRKTKLKERLQAGAEQIGDVTTVSAFGADDMKAQYLIFTICDRTTSRPDDEAIVIASALALDPKPIMDVQGDERMKVLIQSMPFVPLNMLFCCSPRLTFPGFRWAPATLLRSKGARNAFRTPTGIFANEADLQASIYSARSMSSLDPAGRGLVVSCPAVRPAFVLELRDASSPPAFHFAMLGRRLAFEPCIGCRLDEDTRERLALEIRRTFQDGREVVILLDTFDYRGQMRRGALVELPDCLCPLDQVERAPIQAKYLCTVRFSKKSTAENAELLRRSLQMQSRDHVLRHRHKICLNKGCKGGEVDLDKMEPQAEWIWPRWWLVD